MPPEPRSPEPADQRPRGPLAGRTVIELAGLGPGPFACMLLADLGADVIRIDRPGGPSIPSAAPEFDLINRGKQSVVLDLKRPGAVEAVLALTERADALVEGFRPGVAERLGLGPDIVMRRNPRIIYARMTGWGQDGPFAGTAGHDINYLAVTGALHAIGPFEGPPQIPLNLVGDLGGGAMYLAVGVLSAWLESDRTGHGQVIDAAVVDGTAHLLTLFHTMLASGQWVDRRQHNLIDGGRPFYGVYRTADDNYMAVGAIEPKFFAELIRLLQIPTGVIDPAHQYEPGGWPQMRAVLAAAFAQKSRAQWTEIFNGSDACVTPVLSMNEAASHEQLAARRTLDEDVQGRLNSHVAPRFSGHPVLVPAPPAALGQHTRTVLSAAGVDADALIRTGAAVG